MIHITDHKTDEILTFIDEEFFWDDTHRKSLKDNIETFNFTTFADKDFSEYLADKNRLVIPDEDGQFIEFEITNTRKYRSKSALKCDIYSSASYLSLKTAKVIDPQTTGAISAEDHAINALSGTEYEVGNVSFKGIKTFAFEDYTNPYKYLKRIASEFDLELHFRVEASGNRIARRYVDLVERVGLWRGRESEFGKDLEGIERKEDFSRIVTALVGISPPKVDGTRLEVFVENKDALTRWGRNGQHIIEPYEPQSSDQNMTESRLRTLAENELEKRISSSIEYIADIIDLENVIGLEHEEIRFGDTFKIKDTKFNPPLYLEARVHTQERSIKSKGKKVVTLGDFIEYTESEVMAIWKSLQEQIRRKISMSDLEEVTYTKPEIDQKDEKGNQAADKIETDIGWSTPIESTQGAQDKADQAKDDAIDYTDGIKQQIDQELLDKAGLEYVNGQLSYKADSELVNTINNTVGNLQQLVDEHSGDLEDQGGRLISVEQDLDEVEGELSTTISNLSALGDTVSQQSTQISANTTAIGLKAEQADLETLEGNVTTIGTQVGELEVSYNGITANVRDLEAVVDGHTTNISDLNTEFDVLAGEVSSKVSATYVENAIADINIGGRNLFLNSREFVDNRSSYEIIGGQRYGYYGYAWNFTFNVDLVEGETYTVSVPVYNSSETEISRARIIRGHLGNYIETIQPKEIKIITNTFTATETEDNALFRLLTHDSSYPTLAWAYPNLVKGNKATDWSPAPEDTQSDIDSVFSYAESSFTQLADEMELKVNVDGVISAINLTSETAKIQAQNIELQGAVTVLSDITGDLGTISAGKINGTTIRGSYIYGTDIIRQGDGGDVEIDNLGVTVSGTDGFIRFSVGETAWAGDETRIQFNAYSNDPNQRTLMYRYNDKFYIETDAGIDVHGGTDGIFLNGTQSTHNYGVSVSGGMSIGDGLGTNFHRDGTVSQYSDVEFGLDAKILYKEHAFLSLTNGWTAYGSSYQSPRYTKMADGMVYLSGLASAGTFAATMATLPAGCRPNQVEQFTVATYGNGQGKVYVYPSGTVRAQQGDQYLSLSGICFLAEN